MLSHFQPAEMSGGQYQVMSTKLHHSVYSLTDSSDVGPDDEEVDAPQSLTPLEKLTTDMCKNENTVKELIIGRRVGFYKVRGEIGSGTFSRVKLAFHALTKGKCKCSCTVQDLSKHLLIKNTEGNSSTVIYSYILTICTY